MKYCPYCGADISVSAFSFCPECGKSLADKKQSKKEKRKKRDKKPEIEAEERTEEISTEQSNETVQDNYDGYYDDVRPVYNGETGQQLDKGLIKKIAILVVCVLLIIGVCVALMLLL